MKATVSSEEPTYFYLALDLLVGIVIVMAVLSIGMMLYGGMQFIGR
jgi:hypothetical protein